MSDGGLFVLGSIEAMRPVFMIVMGVFLLLFAWRLAKTSDSWTARVLMAGAVMLAFGYSLVLPLYEAGVLEHYHHLRVRYDGSAATALGWHVTKLVIMNFGWLVFGIGLAMHSKIMGAPAPAPQHNPACSPHESAA